MSELEIPQIQQENNNSQYVQTAEQINRIADKLAVRSLGIVEKARLIAPGKEWNDQGYDLEKREMSPPGEIINVYGIDEDEDSYLGIHTEDDSVQAPYRVEDRRVKSLVSGDTNSGQKVLEINKNSTEIVRLGSAEGFSRITTDKTLLQVDRDSAAKSLSEIRSKIAKVEKSVK